MNYKVMQRPMFKMGGKAASQGTGITSGLDEKVNMSDGRANYSDGPRTRQDFLDSAFDKLAKRDEALANMDNLINLQALGGVNQVLSGVESNNPLDIITALATQGTQIALPALLQKSKLNVKRTDPTTDLAFAKALKETGGFGEKVYNMKLRQLGNLEEQSAILRDKLNKKEIDQATFDIEMSKINRRFKLISSQFKTDADYISEARSILEGDSGPFSGVSAPEDKVLEKAAELKALESRILQADGGRVDRAMGTPITGEQPMENPMAVEKKDVAMETQGQGNDAYAMLRARLPQEIPDDVVRLIAYNKEAFADFASIKNQEDVSSFNQKYGVSMNIDVSTV